MEETGRTDAIRHNQAKLRGDPKRN